MFLEKGNTMFLAMELNQTTKEAVEAKGYDYSEFVGFVANEWGEGAHQALSSDELDGGQNYSDAKQAIESCDGSELLSDWLKHKVSLAESKWDAAVNALDEAKYVYIDGGACAYIVQMAWENAFSVETHAEYSDDVERWENALATLRFILDDLKGFDLEEKSNG